MIGNNPSGVIIESERGYGTTISFQVYVDIKNVESLLDNVKFEGSEQYDIVEPLGYGAELFRSETNKSARAL